ncbi:Omega-amino acid--pyruvate aminotransferase [uncultured Alphaproteobacteria bacterium]|uniref:Omega-amino acid--pyruvate aminotransferase n=1 Tax=uncultured Alphaproteobacteria bacterium TaxID=91750 RepID=A0A212KN24_9PROT|nr:Omega-amino acid--pyruvate aminotransferase [uncultured Alphaproteobacteria bacterium]
MTQTTTMPNDLSAHWMPFTGNRWFKAHPRMIASAKGCHYTTADGRTLVDGLSGLWCCGAGHARPEIAEAIGRQATQLDYAPGFQVGQPLAFTLATRLAELAPGDLNHVFFTNSGSESADTAIKMARGYWRVKGEPNRSKVIGRVKAYHGVNFGGMSVGGIAGNRKMFGAGIDADHLPHTLLAANAFSKGLPDKGVEKADELEDIIALHDASTIAAVILEPLSGSAGVILPPKGYMQRIREICDKYGILLIFDEVITGFGRTGRMFGAEALGVTPDLMTVAKMLTNGTVPMGAVFASDRVYDTFMENGGPEYAIEFPHGYTYSGHPIACAAALATLDVIETDGLVGRAAALAPYFEDAIHSLKGLPHVEDIRNFGLAGAVQLEELPGQPAKRAFDAFQACWDKGAYVRCGGNTLQFAPAFVAEKTDIDRLFGIVAEVLKSQA